MKFYQDFAPKHPAFEVVFFSEDRSAFNMENAMRQGAMPWPALAFDRLAQQADLAALGKQVTPRLTLIDGAGRIVSDSVVDEQYVGPQHVWMIWRISPTPRRVHRVIRGGALAAGRGRDSSRTAEEIIFTTS